MTQATPDPAGLPPSSTPPAAPTPPPAPATRAWYASPIFWTIVLLLLLIACVCFALWSQFARAQETVTAVQQQELLAIERQNALLEADIARMRTALKDDPCLAQGVLNSLVGLPQAAPQSSPRSGEPLMIPSGNGQPTATPQEQGTGVTPTTDGSLDSADTPQAVPPAQTTPVAPPTGTGIAPMLEKATVLLLSDSPEGLRMGTGFFIGKDTILTNQHVVGNTTKPVIVVGEGVGIIKGNVIHRTADGGRDYAVLTVAPQAVTPLTFNTHISRTQKVSAWGYPGAVTKDDPKFQALLQGKKVAAPDVVYSEGTVSVILQRTPPLIVHSAVVSQGNSGGPLVNAQGEVVGINTYIKLDDESYRQSSLAIVASDILQYLQSVGVAYSTATAKE